MVKPSEKLPWIKFFPGDWLKDPNLSMCSAATRGIWMDLLCAMHESSRSGKLSGTTEQLARVCRCTAEDMTSTIEELKATKTATVTVSHEIVTVVNRRMDRDAKVRETDRIRQQRHRRHAPVTPPSAVEVRSHMSETPIVPFQGNGNRHEEPFSVKDLWLILFEYYPAHRRGDPDSGFPEFAKLKPNQAMLDRMIAAIGKLKESDSWTEKGGKFVPGLVKWLAAKGWESVPIKVEACKTCNRTGAILRNGDKVLPWSLEGEGELTPEICPDCKGKNRISVAGFPQKLELELIRKK